MRRSLLLTAVTLALLASPAFGASDPTAGCEVVSRKAGGQTAGARDNGCTATIDDRSRR